jgi:hypothetical protein
MGGMKITSSGMRRGIPGLVPIAEQVVHVVDGETVIPSLRIWMSRMEPVLEGPPAWMRAETSVDMEETVYAPGWRACPTT